ncbi:uncharacterized protein B0H64DRAFT_24002 [Chaetomium fimeti]|uniref:Uncharacterized protein n=1 Tax=Chaetomium fimeti TaxID=1854472 RepID=A0AAE0HQK3_9PEZI|nr:hypothetical protein B0H64DRAFT_24002 [Chaetomium fimeti]
MSSDSGNPTTSANDMARQRRGSITSSAFTNLFRNNSVSQPTAAPFSTPLASSAANDQRRRLSVTTLGLSGTSPSTSAILRRGSLSTNSDSIDENAIEDEESTTRTAPVPPFARRMSFGATQAMRGSRSATSPGTNGRQPQSMRRSSTVRGSPPTPPLPSSGAGNYTWGKISSQASTANQSRAGSDLCSPSARLDQGFNWSDQLRSRAESTVASGPRASFSFGSGLSASPPRAGPPPAPPSPHHNRAKSVSDMPAPPAQPPRPRAPQKPDAFQERILKGDFYMD